MGGNISITYICRYCESMQTVQMNDKEIPYNPDELTYSLYKDTNGKEYSICPICKEGIVTVVKELLKENV